MNEIIHVHLMLKLLPLPLHAEGIFYCKIKIQKVIEYIFLVSVGQFYHPLYGAGSSPSVCPRVDYLTLRKNFKLVFGPPTEIFE